MDDFSEYKDAVVEDIEEQVGSKPVQPIIFAGSGLSIRYFSGPDWDSLLKEMADPCPKMEHNYGYYRQNNTQAEMGQILADRYARWAWDRNEGKFDEMDLSHNDPQDTYLKYEVSEHFKGITPESIDDMQEDRVSGDLSLEDAKNEIDELVNIQPHAVITTNYDGFLENIYNRDDDVEDKYEVIVGEQIFQSPHKNVGELLKIHGSVTDPSSLVLTDHDYDEFSSQKHYLSSKMLTYFVEHPLLITGYSASDPNIRKIFSWVNQVYPDDKLIEKDIYFLEYDSEVRDRQKYSLEKRIQLGGERYISVKGIVAKNFDWVFEAFASGKGFEVDVRYLRKLLANTYEVVRSRTSGEKVVDHQRVENAAEDTDELATIFGISAEGSELNFEFDHDYSPEELFDELGIDSAYDFKEKVLLPIYEEEGVNITKFNNRYHIAFFDQSVEYRAYSEAAIELFREVLEDEDWSIGIPEERIPNEEIEEHGLDLSEVTE